MGADMPKVLFEIAGKPLVHWVIKACRDAGVERIIVVVGYQGHLVRESLADVPNCEFVEQTELLGTGHAAMMAEPAFSSGEPRRVVVLAGDMPLVKPQTLQKLISIHVESEAAATLGTGLLDDPTGYGRIVRDEKGEFVGIVEQKDATDEQRAIKEINPSFYCFQSDLLFHGLTKVDRGNKQGEYYLTDVPAILKQQGYAVSLVTAVEPLEMHGVNTPDQLAEVERLMLERLQDQGKEPA